MKRLIALRKRYQAFGRGSIEFLHPRTRKVLAFMRALRATSACWWSPTCRASCSTSSSTSPAFAGMRAGRAVRPDTPFPPIGELPYLLTLGPHAFYWFALSAGQPAAASPPARSATQPTGVAPGLSAPAPERPVVRTTGDWRALVLVTSVARSKLRCWSCCRPSAGSPARGPSLKAVAIVDAIPIEDAWLAIVRVVSAGSVRPVSSTWSRSRSSPATRRMPRATIGRGRCSPSSSRGRERRHDGRARTTRAATEFGRALLDTIARRRRFAATNGAARRLDDARFAALRGQGSHVARRRRCSAGSRATPRALRRPTDAEGLPPRCGGDESRAGDRPLPDRARRASRTSRRWPARSSSSGPRGEPVTVAVDPGLRAERGRRLALHHRPGRALSRGALLRKAPEAGRPGCPCQRSST